MSLKSAGAPWQPPTPIRLNLVFVPTAASAGLTDGRAKANLYTCSLVALNADTGKLVEITSSPRMATHRDAANPI
jgi:hypothetical protein